MFYDKMRGKSGRNGEPEGIMGECDAGVPRARENTMRAFSSSWRRALREGVKQQEAMCIVQRMLVQREQKNGGRLWDGRDEVNKRRS